MTETKLAAVVMAGGLGTRMRSSVPKHLHPILGRRMVDWVLEAARPLEPARTLVVASPATRDAFGDVEVAVQERALGTGDAIRSTRDALEGAVDEVLVLSGDTPLLTSDLLAELLETHRREDAAATVLSFEPVEPRSYGRIVRAADGSVRAIVEALDATPEELALRECNSSIYVFRADRAVARARAARAPQRPGRALSHRCSARPGRAWRARRGPRCVRSGRDGGSEHPRGACRRRRRAARPDQPRAHAGGRDDRGSRLDVDRADRPARAGGGRAPVHDSAGASPRSPHDAEIGPHAVLLDAQVGPGATVGPFCYLRAGTVLAPRSKAGTFVEIKKSRIGAGSKVPHLSYIGDAEIGEETNIGAGSITANFPHLPGQPKGKTTIGDNARVAVDTMFVAPVTVGDDVWTAPGSVVTDDVPDNALVGFAPRQTIKEGRGGKRNR